MPTEPCNANHPLMPGEAAIDDLTPGALFVVAALRAWVAPLMYPGEEHPDWREIFRQGGVRSTGAVGFDMVMSVVAGQAQRLLEVRCCHCPGVGADEALMLHMIAALQADDMQGAIAVLADWLPQSALAPALCGARRFAAEISAAGLHLRLAALPTARPVGVALH